MADTQSNIQVNIDTTQALASIKNLQRQISAFHSSMAKGGAAANAVSAQMQQTLINSINATGKFSAQIRTIRTTTESFTTALEKNKFSLGEYFRYAGGASKTFGRLFKTEFDTINKVARENVKDLQTQYIRMGRDASGAMKAIAVRPLSLDMTDLGTRTQVAAQKQAILNQLLKQGSTNLLNFGKNTQWAGRQLMVGFTLPLIAVGSAASKTFMDMETQAIRFKKVYGDLFTPQTESVKALKDIQELGKEFTKYGIAVSTTVGLAAEAAAAGFKGVDLQRQTAAATRLSILGQVDSQKALETTIALQNAFSMSSENLAESIDFLNAVENQTVLSLDDVSTAIPKAAPVIQQLGGDVKDLAFFMTAMKEGGINASEGANALKSGLASMINPTGKAVAMLESFGINVKKIVLDNKGDLKKTVVEFATALNMLDPLNRAQAIEQMFGKFQFARLSTLFANVTKEGTQASRVLDLAGSSVQQLASLSEKELGITSESAMNKFKASVENLKLSLIPLGEQFLKAVTPIAEFITKILDKFNGLSDRTKKIIVVITSLVAGLGPVLLMTAGLVMNGLANMIKLFAFLKSAFNKTGQSTATLGTEVKYMTTEQRNAAAVAASLDQVHTKLAQTFTSEATAVNALTRAYQRAIAAQSQFVPVGPPITRGPIKKFAGGRPSTVGGTGNTDSELALLMPGETVIPTAMSAKYGSLINAMIADKVPGYDDGKPKIGANQLPIYPEHAIRLQPAAENMAGRASTTDVPSVLSPLALRIGEARGIAPTSSQISSGRFDGIYREYEQITSQFVERLNTEYNTTFADIKDENERMRKSWSAAGKAVEKQVDSIAAPKERAVLRRTFGLDEDVYGTIPTDSREAGGTAPNRSRRGAFKSRLTGLRSYTRIRPGAKKLFERMTGKSAADLQMGHVFPPRAVDISTLESDPKKSGSVATARAVMERGKKDGEAYDRGVKTGTRDIYEASRDRRSPHPQAAIDGKDDARAYAAARDKETRKQSGRARRVATRAQGPAPIGATPQPGARILPIISRPGPSAPIDPTDPTKPSRGMSVVRGAGTKLNSMGGGMGLLGLNMGLSMAPDFAGKGIAQAGLAGANLGMMFGPYGMAVGATLGVITAGYTKLIDKQKEYAAITKSTFTVSTDLITAFGDKVLDTNVKITALGKSSFGLQDIFGILSPEIQAIIDSLKKLPENDPLALFIKKISKTGQSFNDVTGNLRSKVTTDIALGGLDPKNAQKYIFTLMSAAGKANQFGAVWKSISKDVIDAATATTASFNKLGDSVNKAGGQFTFLEGPTGDTVKKYEDLRGQSKNLADQMFSFFNILTNGSFTFDQMQERIAALGASSIDTKTSVLALESAIRATGDAALIERFSLIKKMFEATGQAATATTGDFVIAHQALEMLADQNKNLDDVRRQLFGMSTAASVMSEELVLQNWISSNTKDIKIYINALAESRKEFEKTFNTNDYTDPTDGVDGLSKASEAYLKVLDLEIKGLEAKRDAQKNANDETQRQIDLQMKLKDLANQAVLAKISGDYLKAATLEQQAQNVQMEFDQETELKKKDAEIARLKAREAQIKAGAVLTKAETAKIPKVAGAKKAASGGAIRGAGTGTSDSIPAYLSNGEYVIKADSVKKYGTQTFDALNAGRFAEGGLINPAGFRNMAYGPDRPDDSSSYPELLTPRPGYVIPNTPTPKPKNKTPKMPMRDSLLGGTPDMWKSYPFGLNPRDYAENPYTEKPYKHFDYFKEFRPKYGTHKKAPTKYYAMGGLVPGYKDGGLGSRPKYGKKQNWFQRYVAKLTKSQKEGARMLPSFMTSNGKADALGAGSMLRKITGQSESGDTLNAALFPLNFLGMGSARNALAKPAAGAATKSQGLLSKLFNLPATRRAETILRQKQIADDIARFKANPPPLPPPRPGAGAPGAPPTTPTKSMWDDDYNWGDLPEYNVPVSKVMAKSSIFSKILDSSVGKKVKTLSRVASTPAYHLKSMASSARRAWKHGPSSLRWSGKFDQDGRFGLANEAVSRLFGSLGQKFNPKIKIPKKINALPANLPEGTSIYDPLTFFEKLLLDRKNPNSFYSASYKNIFPNLRDNYAMPFMQKVSGGVTDAVHKMAGISKITGSQVANKGVSIKDTMVGLVKSLSYKIKSGVKDKYRSFLNIFKTTKVGKPFENSPIDYRSLVMTGESAASLHAPQIAEEIVGGSQYYVKMVTELKRAKELFGSEWMHRVDLPAPVNRPVTNAPEPFSATENTAAVASESFIPKGFQTVKDFIAGAMNNPSAFMPSDLGEVVRVGIIKQRLAADVAQSVIGHGDLHTGNQIIDVATGKIGMLDFEEILNNDWPTKLPEIAEILKIKDVSPTLIADSLKEGLRKITDIPPSEILDMMKRAKVPKPEQLLETYLSRLEMTKKQIDEIISTKLFLADGGYINKEKLRVPKFAKGGLIKGPGTGISDSVRATLGYAGGGSVRVSNGEYVVKASSVKDYGVKTMDAINNGTATVGANSSGTVYNINMPVTSNNANPEIVANEVMRKLKLEISKNNKTNKVGG